MLRSSAYRIPTGPSPAADLGVLAGPPPVGVPAIWISNMKTYAGPVSIISTELLLRSPVCRPDHGGVLRWSATDRKPREWPEWVRMRIAIRRPARQRDKCGCR